MRNTKFQSALSESIILSLRIAIILVTNVTADVIMSNLGP
jgi:hypothetical protein